MSTGIQASVGGTDDEEREWASAGVPGFENNSQKKIPLPLRRLGGRS